MSEWLELARRCEQATGADQSTDETIATALGWEFVGIAGDGAWVIGRGDAMKALFAVPEFTTSLDAITALIERELPSAWVWTLGQNVHHRTWGASINNLNEYGEPYSVCWGQSRYSPALALCAAFCRAMAEKEKHND